MNARTTVSAKGQVVIPKDVRNRFRFAPGDRLDIVERPDGVLLRKSLARSSESFDAIAARMRSRVHYAGAAISIEEMDAALGDMWHSGGPRWDA